MKIGIVTYFDICNYGSVLQAYAMKRALSLLGYDAVFLNIKEEKWPTKYLHKLYVGLITIIKCITNKEALKTHCEIRSLRRKNISFVSKECRHKFNDFIKINLPSLTIDRISLRRRSKGDEFGAFICGSDQIWSPLSLSLSSHKFLEFAPMEKRIAYAPSFGVEEIPSYNRNHVYRALKKFDSISVREISGANIIKKLIGKDVPVVLDPTMLFDGDEWRMLYREHAGYMEKENYILCYFFDEPEEEILDLILSFSKEKKQSIVVLSDKNYGMISRGAEVIEADPWQFLSLIDHSAYVFTNSFHGSVFSVLFGKRFIVFGRKHSKTVQQTSRISNLLEILGAQKNFYDKSLSEFVFLDPTDFAEKLCEPRKMSFEYLSKCLEKVNIK